MKMKIKILVGRRVFQKVKEMQNLMHNHIFVTIKRMLEVSKSYPEQLVTALRIIEREEA